MKNYKTKELFDGKEYSILSRNSVRNDEVTFGDILADTALVLPELDREKSRNIASFISTHISERSKRYFGDKDVERDLFLQMMVALKVLKPIKKANGCETGYVIIKYPTASDLVKARDFSLDKHNNDRGFETFKSNELLLKETAKKSNRLMCYLINTILNSYGFEINNEYEGNDVRNTLSLLYTDRTIHRLINCLATRGFMELNYYENEDNSTRETIKFNKLPLDIDSIDLYNNFEFISSDCKHVHRIPYVPQSTTINKPSYFESFTELNLFYKNNMIYLLKKFPEEF